MVKKIICDKCGHQEDMVKYYGWCVPWDGKYNNIKQKWFYSDELKMDLCLKCNEEYKKSLAQFKGGKK